MIAAAIAAFARVVSGAAVRWKQPLSGSRQRAFYANHASHLDFVVIWSALPAEVRARTRPVAGSDYWGRGAVRPYVAGRVFRAILIERSTTPSSPDKASQAIDQIATAMGGEDSIIVFPEGTRSLNGELLPFKSGLYHLCVRKPGIELVPVYLSHLNRILPKGEILPVPLRGRVTFGAPTHLEPGEDKEAFLNRTRAALLELKDT